MPSGLWVFDVTVSWKVRDLESVYQSSFVTQAGKVESYPHATTYSEKHLTISGSWSLNVQCKFSGFGEARPIVVTRGLDCYLPWWKTCSRRWRRGFHVRRLGVPSPLDDFILWRINTCCFFLLYWKPWPRWQTIRIEDSPTQRIVLTFESLPLWLCRSQCNLETSILVDLRAILLMTYTSQSFWGVAWHRDRALVYTRRNYKNFFQIISKWVAADMAKLLTVVTASSQL